MLRTYVSGECILATLRRDEIALDYDGHLITVVVLFAIRQHTIRIRAARSNKRRFAYGSSDCIIVRIVLRRIDVLWRVRHGVERRVENIVIQRFTRVDHVINSR